MSALIRGEYYSILVWNRSLNVSASIREFSDAPFFCMSEDYSMISLLFVL